MRYEESIEEWLEEFPGHFEVGPIGVWEILLAGREGFVLEGPALVDFCGRAVRRLLEFGAQPVTRRKDGPYSWVAQDRYGATTDEIIAAVVEEQMGPEGENPDSPGLWFATPEMLSIPNRSIEEWMTNLPSRLEKGPVSLSELTLVGQAEYDLADDTLVEFARGAMRRLLEHGARPARISLEGPPEWLPTPQYGETVENVLDAVTARWSHEGLDVLLATGLAFALPEHVTGAR